MKGPQRIEIRDGAARLVLELRGVRELTDADRAILEARLWDAFAMGDVYLALQKLELCEVTLAPLQAVAAK